jgi:hypothetical protein
LGEFLSEGEEDEEEDEEALETHRETRQRTGCSKLAAGTKHLNNTVFYTPLSSGGRPASAMPAPFGPKGRRAAVRERRSTHDYIFNLPPRTARYI